MKTRSMVSFDWAMKRLLRNKANFEILEGFLSELLRRKIIIKNIGESQGNRTDKDDKANQVDILVEADNKELVIIELQYFGEDEYFQRMLYGASKAITEHIESGDPYTKVRKVYSINIVYFDLGTGDDYVYHGFTDFKGLHTQNELQLDANRQRLYGKTYPGELYPEYYLIKVGKFDDVAKDTLDEWIFYLKNNRIRDDFTAQGIDKARKILAIDNLTDEEKRQHDREIKNMLIRNSQMRNALSEGETIGLVKGEAIGLEKGKAIGLEKGEAIGLEKGKAIGLEEGEVVGMEKSVINGFQAGHSLELISTFTGLTVEQITEILFRHGLI
jgi:predicted transposase/invertase (TIGR01784 family)